MKRLLLASVAFSALIIPGMAADMPPKAPPQLPTWTGLYWGVNAGWVGSSQYDITNTGTDSGPLGLARIIHDSTSFSSPRGARAPSTSPDLIRIGV